MMRLFKYRSEKEEIMECSSTTIESFETALKDIQWVNKHLNGTNVLIKAIEKIIADVPKSTFTVLDLGCGSADIPLALHQWGKENGIQFQITAIDRHPYAVQYAKRITSGNPDIEILQNDALKLSYPNEFFDITISSMFLHHLDTEQAVHLLQEMARLSRIGFVINDLKRHPIAYLSILMLGKILDKGSIFQNDAPLSVLRGFTYAEAGELKKHSGLTDLQIEQQPPYRIVMTWKNPELFECI